MQLHKKTEFANVNWREDRVELHDDKATVLSCDRECLTTEIDEIKGCFAKKKWLGVFDCWKGRVWVYTPLGWKVIYCHCRHMTILHWLRIVFCSRISSGWALLVVPGQNLVCACLWSLYLLLASVGYILYGLSTLVVESAQSLMDLTCVLPLSSLQ